MVLGTEEGAHTQVSRRTAIYLLASVPVVIIVAFLISGIAGPTTTVVGTLAFIVLYWRMWRGSWFTQDAALKWGRMRGGGADE